jgi:hypothetical protein
MRANSDLENEIESLMPEAEPTQPFYLIVADHTHGIFAAKGPMNDDRPWQSAARKARDYRQRKIACGPSGPDREALAAEFRRTNKLTGVPPGTILRPIG